jgi:methylated-DNA-protein-cysteine methyltransferase-like protein
MSQYEDVYTVVRQIPRGKVSTYGRVADLCGFVAGNRARRVGYALFALAGNDDVPWWRVVNAAGRISNPYNADLQRALLEAEGTAVDATGRVDLRVALWAPDAAMP